MKDHKQLWFKAKMYGWGWQPVSWQGWVVLAVYVFAIVKIFRTVDAASHSNSDTLIGFALPFTGLTLILLAICYTKGERLRWRCVLNEVRMYFELNPDSD